MPYFEAAVAQQNSSSATSGPANVYRAGFTIDNGLMQIKYKVAVLRVAIYITLTLYYKCKKYLFFDIFS